MKTETVLVKKLVDKTLPAFVSNRVAFTTPIYPTEHPYPRHEKFTCIADSCRNWVKMMYLFSWLSDYQGSEDSPKADVLPRFHSGFKVNIPK